MLIFLARGSDFLAYDMSAFTLLPNTVVVSLWQRSYLDKVTQWRPVAMCYILYSMPLTQASKAKARKDEEKKNEAADDGDKKKAQRATSNVFAMFSKNQIQEFKEVTVAILFLRHSRKV